MVEILETFPATLSYVAEVISNPIHLAITGLCGLLLCIYFAKKRCKTASSKSTLRCQKLNYYTLEDLRQFDGTKGPDKKILLAINGKVFDVTKGQKLYGQGGQYASFAGRDATRALSTLSAEDVYRLLADVFSDKYNYVGRLLNPGEEPPKHSDSNEQ